MSLYDFIGAFYSDPQPQSEFERLRREAREAIYKGMGFDAGVENWADTVRSYKYGMREEPLVNHFRERTIYHRDGSRTVFRNYAIIKTDEKTYKAPILDPEGRLVRIGP